MSAKRAPDGTAYFSGVLRCGRVWACPVCGPKIRHGRAQDIAEALSAAVARRYTVLFLTLTLRHTADDELAHLIDQSEKAWKSLQQTSGWRAMKAEVGWVGAIQTREVTWGETNGWHPHRHMALIVEEVLDDVQLAHLETRIWAMWDRQLVKRGLSSVRAFGADLRRCNGERGLAEYLTKITGDSADRAALELARGDLKTARPEHWTPEGILDEWGASRLPEWGARWQEYEEATNGRRMITWSHGLRDALAITVEERTDQEIAEEEVGGKTVLVLDSLTWGYLWKSSTGCVELLEAIEAGTHVGYLASLGLSSSAGAAADPPTKE